MRINSRINSRLTEIEIPDSHHIKKAHLLTFSIKYKYTFVAQRPGTITDKLNFEVIIFITVNNKLEKYR